MVTGPPTALLRPHHTPYRPVVQHQLVAAHVDEDLARVGAGGFVALGGDHDADARRLFLVHGEEKEIAVPETEFLGLGRVIEIDRGGQVAELGRNVEGDAAVFQERAGDGFGFRRRGGG